jgi:hypothetical protein
MPVYSLFGSGFDSELVCPELPLASGDGPVAWRFRLERTPAPPVRDQDRVGAVDTLPGIWARLSRLPAGGFRFDVDDAGAFDVSADGSELTWYEPRPSMETQACMYATSLLLSLSFHLAGSLCLHASAVTVDGVGIAFMAPKFHGKSTLAAATVRAGGHLLTDDTLVVQGDPPRLLPGLHGIRLREDSARHLGHDEGLVHVPSVERHVVTPRERIATRSVPFAAVYLVNPVAAAPEGPAVARARMSAFEGAAMIMGQSKIRLLFDPPEQFRVFERATQVAAQVPVYRLDVLRDFSRVNEVGETICGWHAGGPALVGA